MWKIMRWERTDGLKWDTDKGKIHPRMERTETIRRKVKLCVCVCVCVWCVWCVCVWCVCVCVCAVHCAQ